MCGYFRACKSHDIAKAELTILKKIRVLFFLRDVVSRALKMSNLMLK